MAVEALDIPFPLSLSALSCLSCLSCLSPFVVFSSFPTARDCSGLVFTLLTVRKGAGEAAVDDAFECVD